MTDYLDGDVRAYYDRGAERERLRQGTGLLEFARTRELIARHVPADAIDVLDVGGGPGTYAQWLCGLGHRVTLIDPIPLHVEQARQAHPGINATLGDARDLPADDTSADVVLLLGPLYHLVEPDDRARALAEAVRCVRPGGLIIAAVISRYAALLDLLIHHDRLHEEGVFQAASTAIQTGIFRGTTRDLFTTAYFHLPEEILAETVRAGLTGLGCSTSKVLERLPATSASAGPITLVGKHSWTPHGLSKTTPTCWPPPATSWSSPASRPDATWWASRRQRDDAEPDAIAPAYRAVGSG